MKNYEYGFYAESGEFFELREFGFENGRKLYVSAESAEEAYNEFLIRVVSEYSPNEMNEEMTIREIPTGHDLKNYFKIN